MPTLLLIDEDQTRLPGERTETARVVGTKPSTIERIASAWAVSPGGPTFGGVSHALLIAAEDYLTTETFTFEVESTTTGFSTSHPTSSSR